ncbi:hypothetical protein FA95DRAFT_1575631 [Auriscalpium vulgare]|uniref:Uncharacterized protein n=1 Tax=Auriscalpium vulgare TaxID=40419 RepID=A0ACB8REG0_9AGAM|nr:hypothetical protein FA95DRAFT_1575631 [Auriscalpium vulgare]
MTPPEPPGGPPIPNATDSAPSERMNIDTTDLSPIEDTALAPAIAPFPTSGIAATGVSAPSIPSTEVVDILPNVGARSNSESISGPDLTPACPAGSHSLPSVSLLRRPFVDKPRKMCSASRASVTSHASLKRRADLQNQLEAIRLEHAALVRDHVATEQALDHARAASQPRARSPSGETSSSVSQRRRSPRPDSKKRRRNSPTPAPIAAHRTTAVDRPSSIPRSGRSSRATPQGSQWAGWEPRSHEDVSFLFIHAATDPNAAARARTLALAASDLAVDDRHPVQRFLVQQWGLRRNTLAAPSAMGAPTPPPPTSLSSGGGHGADAWTEVSHGKRRDNSSKPPSKPNKTPSQSSRPHREPPTVATTPAVVAPAYTAPIEDWIEYIRANPGRCPPGVPVYPENSILRGSPVRRLLERHIEMRRNGPEGREQVHRASRGHWVSRTTQLFSIRGLYERVLHAEHISPTGSIPQSRPYTGDTRNLSFADVARHFARNGYQPRSLAVSELEEYAAARRNLTDHRPRSSTAEWGSFPTLAEMNPRLAPSRQRVPALAPSSGSMSPDFPAHYEPSTPHFVPIADDTAGPLPPVAASWADDDYSVNNSLASSQPDAGQVDNVNNSSTAVSAVDPASIPTPMSRSVTPMDASE